MSNLNGEEEDIEERVFEDNLKIKTYLNLEKKQKTFLNLLIICFVLLFLSIIAIIVLFVRVLSIEEKNKDTKILTNKIESLSIELNKTNNHIEEKIESIEKNNITIVSQKISDLTKETNQNKKEISQIKNEILLLIKLSHLNYISVIYQVTNSSESIRLFNPENIEVTNENCSLIIDGIIQKSISNGFYKFNSPGEHYVLISFNVPLFTLYGIFDLCHEIIEIDLSRFHGKSVFTVQRFCADCISLKSINLKNFDTSSIVDYYRMFLFAKSITSIDFSGFNTTNAQRLNSLVFGCFSLTSLDLSNFDTSNASNMWYMFSFLPNIKYLDLRSFTVKTRRSIDFIFDDTTNTNQSTVIVNSSNEQQFLIEVIHEKLSNWNIIDVAKENKLNEI